MDAPAITRSLDIAAERAGDLTALVYARLFADHPDMAALFVRDTDGLVMGEMLARVFEAILDFIDRRAYAAQLIQCEVVTHEGYGVPPDVFGLFFTTVADTVRQAVGTDWTDVAEAAWRDLLAELSRYVAHPDQPRRPERSCSHERHEPHEQETAKSPRTPRMDFAPRAGRNALSSWCPGVLAAKEPAPFVKFVGFVATLSFAHTRSRK